MSSKHIHLRVSFDLLKEIDRAAKAACSTRSDFIRQAIKLRLDHQHISDNKTAEEAFEEYLKLFKSF